MIQSLAIRAFVSSSLVAATLFVAACSSEGAGSSSPSGTPSGSSTPTGYRACYDRYFRYYLDSCTTADACGGALTCDTQGTSSALRCRSVSCSSNSDCATAFDSLCASSTSDPFHYECRSANSLGPNECQLTQGAAASNDFTGKWSGSWTAWDGGKVVGSGSLLFTLADMTSTITGKVTVGGSSCLTAATVKAGRDTVSYPDGNVFEGTMTATGVSLYVHAELDRSGNTITGYWQATTGCTPYIVQIEATRTP